MTIPILLLFAAMQAGSGLQPPSNAQLDQIKGEANPERRSRMAVDYAMAAERNAESAYAKRDLAAFSAALADMEAAVELANESLQQSGKSANRSPKYFKYGEQRTRELTNRLDNLERTMDLDDRHLMERPRARVTEIHDAWLEGIMSKHR